MKKVRLVLSVYLALYMAFSPLVVVAAGILADGGTQTTTDSARNGVPVVNIANPNASGLSHNTFTDYNVNANGVILNNAMGTVNTQLGGYINGNAHLTQSASVILNEVTSTRSSNLNGFTEVAGQRADLVIANPNGLTINGAGFINTSNVTLTTGKPNIVNGSIGSFDVRGGRITVQGAGLNTLNQNSTQIYANYVTLNAQLHAKKLDIKLGKNVIDQASKTITSSTSAAPTGLLLDASALGGMYADSISLVGTEKGLGVNLPPEVIASLGDISISNDGNIVMQGLHASQQVHVQSQNDIAGSGTVYGGSNVVLNAVKGVVNTGTVAAQQGITISSSSLTNSGTVVAGVAPNGLLNATGIVSINSGNVSNSGSVQSTSILGITASTVDNQGSVVAGSDLNVNATTSLTNSGSLHANRNNTLSSPTLNNSGKITATNNLGITSTQLNSTAGELSGTNVILSVTDLYSAGNILASNTLGITAVNSIDNAGNIQGTTDLNISAASLNNQATGVIQGLQLLTLTAPVVDNQGTMIAGSQLKLNASTSLSNSGTVVAGVAPNGLLNATGTVSINSGNVSNSGSVQSTSTLGITASTVDNQGSVVAGSDLNVNATTSLNNSGSLHANRNNTVSSPILNNSGKITATNNLNITAAQLTSTSGELSGNNVTISSTDLYSAGNISAANNIVLGATGVITNKGNVVAGNNIDALQASSLINSGLMTAGNVHTINVAQSVRNTGTLHAGSNLSIASADVSNTNKILSDALLSITATNGIANQNANADPYAGIVSIGNMVLSAASLDNTGAQIHSAGNQDITVSGILTNTNGLIQGAGTSTVNTLHLNNNGGSIEATNLTLTTSTVDLTNSKVYAANDLFFTLAAMNNVATSEIAAGRNLTITANGGITNNASKGILAGGDLALNTNGGLTNNTTISSQGALSISAGSLNNAANARLTGGTGASNIAVVGNILNNGVIGAINNLDVSAVNITNNHIINAGKDLTIRSSNLTNNKTLFSGRDMNLYTTGTLSNTSGANIFAVRNMTLAANAAGGKTTKIVNTSANIEALGNISISVGTLDNIPGVTPTVVAGTMVTTSLPNRQGAPKTWLITSLKADTRTDTINFKGYTKSTIASGGNLAVTANTVNNKYSEISAAGNVKFSVGILNNVAVLTAYTYVTEKGYYETWRTQRKCNVLGCWTVGPAWYALNNNTSNPNWTKVIPKTITPNQQAFSTLQAGKGMTLNGGVLNNTGKATGVVSALTQNTATTASGASLTSTTTSTSVGGAIGSGANQVNIAPPTAGGAIGSGANQVNIVPPTGNGGLFVTSPSPSSQYLIETNPEFTIYENFISSDYMLQQLDFSPERTTKRLGDAFYESRLIKDSLFAQTGRRFLSSDITSDYDQYKALMDNALASQEDLNLIPGVSLTAAQVAALEDDIVWLEERMVAGQAVLVPVVYIADAEKYSIQGGAIIAGQDIDINVDTLTNGGTLEAGSNLSVNATDTILNMGGRVTAGGTLSLLAENDIENVSGSIAAKNIAIASTSGNVVNKRFTTEFDGGNNQETLIGAAGSIIATDVMDISAGDTISIIGSDIKADTMNLSASQVDILATEVKSSSYIGNADNYVMKRSTTHMGSSIDGNMININSTGVVTIAGSSINANDTLAITGKALLMLAVNDTSYEESKSSSSGFLSSSSTTTKKGRSTNVGSSLTGGNISLTSTSGDITVVGSEVAANGNLALDSAGNIDVRAGYDGTLDETHTESSGWFTGGSIFSKSDDLEGKLTKTAALASLSGNNVSLDAAKDIKLKGVDVAAEESLSASAENITVENAENEVQTYSKHTQMSVGVGDVAAMLSDPASLISVKDGKASISLGTAEFSSADDKTKTTTVVSSNLSGNNISLTAKSDKDGEGNINIIGSNLNGGESIALDASNDVVIKEAKNTETTSSKTQEGKAELKLTVKNEYQQIAVSLQSAKAAKDELQQSKRAYDNYKQDLSSQQAKLATLKADLKAGKLGIEQADIDELSGYIQELAGDKSFYQANIVAATANLATKTTAVASQMATAAASSGTYGFSAGLELDIDTLEKQFASYKETSVGSNLSASNITIKAGNTTTLQGSQLNGDTSIDTDTLNILASKDVNTGSDSSENKNINMSMSTSGSTSFSASADSSQSSNTSTTHTNAGISGGNITINTADKTTIAGANIHANDELTLNTGSLDVSSVQDTTSSSSSSKGMNVGGGSGGISSGGINGGKSSSSSKETLLTSITGESVNINVDGATTIKGATIAAVDEEGNDNGNLSFKTDTLEVSSLNNTNDSKSTSINVSGGGTASVDASADNAHSKTKTLATLGSGNIEVANVEDSDTRMLNRDTTDNEVDIYDIESHKGIKGSLDTRLLTDKGRAKIAEDVKKSKVGFYDVAKDIITKDSLTILDAFSHQGNKVDFFDGMQDAIRSDKDLQKQLADPNLTVEQKNKLMTTLATSVAAKLDIKLGDVSTIATDTTTKDGSQIKGAYHDKTNDIVINDVNIENTGDAVNTLGHELGHAIGYGEEASDVMGESLQDYADFAMWNNTDGQTVASTNNHNGTVDSNGNTIATTGKASQKFIQRHIGGELDYRQLSTNEAKSLDKTKQSISQRSDLSNQQKVVMKVQLDAAACAAVRCAEGVPEDDANYKQLAQLQAIGDKLKAQGLTVDKMLAGPSPEGSFEYGTMDKAQDFITRNDEVVQRGKGAVNAGLGTAGTIVGGAATIATAPLCTTGIGCLAPVGTAALTSLAAAQAVDGASTLFGDYTSEEGQRVLDSFTEETHQGDRNLVGDAALNTALWVGETVVINKVAKLIPDSVKDKARDLITGEKKPDVKPDAPNPSAYHYTDAKWKDAINENGLKKDSYATPNGNLSPTQASIELALPPNRNLPNAKLRIDLDTMRKDGYEIPKPTRVSNTVTGADGRVYTRPGGGYEMKFDYEIPPKYISIVE